MAAALKSSGLVKTGGGNNSAVETSFGDVNACSTSQEKVKDGRELQTDEILVDDTEEEEENEVGTQCGVGKWRPSWLQKFARAEVYALTQALLGFIVLADATYFVGTLSTMEKHLKIPSRTAGFMYSSFELGSLLAMPVVGYVARHLNPMRLVCGGTLLTALACTCFALPHFIFGAGSDALAQAGHYTQVNSSTLSEKSQLLETTPENCESGETDEWSSTWPIVIFCAANLLVGIGTSAHYTVGLAYLDNNSSKNKSPILLATTSCLQMLGSTLGFAVAAMALAFYVEPSLTPSFSNKDQRWIGAWWLGWPLMGGLTAAVGCLMGLFPRRLPQAARRQRQLREAEARAGATPAPDGDTKAMPSWPDMKLTIARLLKNKVLVFNTCSTICLMFGYASHWTFLPKYIETQFLKSASEANLITGSMSLVFTGAGTMVAAIVITRFKPSPRKIAGWNVFTETIDVLSHFSWAFLGCPNAVFRSTNNSDNDNITAFCNTSIICGNNVEYTPVCSQFSDTTFYSPCIAGCTDPPISNNGTKIFNDCACIPDGIAMDGHCTECAGGFMVFITLQCILSFLQATGHSGNMLLAFRCVDEKDKSLSIALVQIAMSVLVSFPAPTIYGALLDTTCITWEEKCGSTGNCKLYDKQMMRYVINFTSTGCLIVGVIFDIGVWLYSSGLKIYDEDDMKEFQPCPTESTHTVANKELKS